MKPLWSRNFTLLTIASTLGGIGGIAAEFALGFLVFDETGSTFAASVILAVQMVPHFLVPLIAAPFMDRYPRKPFLVAGDAINGVLYGIAGLYLLTFEFSYTGYLLFSMLLSTLGAFDYLAYTSLYPLLIPRGQEERGYTVSSMLYPVMKVVMMPVAAVLFQYIGVACILLLQAALSLLGAAVESRIRVQETPRMNGSRFSLYLWKRDISDALSYLKNERGLQGIFGYIAVANGVATGYGPLLVAFFRTTSGLGVALYSFFTVAEFVGRSIGGVVRYRIVIPPKKKFGFAFFVYQFYSIMDMTLLWLPYPLMLANRVAAGFLGINSAVMREAAVQRYIPDEMRARINALSNIMIMLLASIFSLGMGVLGDWIGYRLTVTVGAACALLSVWLLIWSNRSAIHRIYEGDGGR